MTSIKFSIRLAALSFALTPMVSSADAFLPPAITDGTTISGYCQSTGLVSTPQNLSDLGKNSSDALTQMAAVLHSGQLEQLAMEKNLLNQQTQAVSDFLTKLAAAKSSQSYSNENGTANTLDNSCFDQAQATATTAGLSNAKAFRSAVTRSSPIKGQVQTSCGSGGTGCKILFGANPSSVDQMAPVDNTGAAVAALAQTPPAQWQSGTLTDPNATDADVTALIAHSVTPFPRKGVPASVIGQSPALMWQSAATVDRAQTTLAVDALAVVADGHRPTIDSSVAAQQWQQSGQSGAIPGIVNGKISPVDFFSALVQGWYNGPTFSANVKVKDDAWQIKQQALMMSTHLWAQHRENALLAHAVALQAAELALRSQAGVAAVNDARAMTADQATRGQ